MKGLRGLLTVPDHYSDGIPVFKPTMEQFSDFYQYNKSINKYGMQSGIVKVIPPPEWVASLDGCYTGEALELVKIKNPIVQQINSPAPGVFCAQNVERQRSYNMFQWKELSDRTNYQPPAPKGHHRQKSITNTVNDVCHPDASEYTPQRCEELEKNYWRTLTYAEPMYGADMMGSLFTDAVTSWNVARLPNILDLMDVSLPGVNEAYLYAGLWKASFAWHLEDQDLYSINYLHFGAPKQWYSIPQEEAPKFFDLMVETFPDDYAHCAEFLRHKTFIVSPQFLDKHNVKYNKIVHHQQEFIITYPYGYHAGFNYGYNLAELVNFALDDWFPIGQQTKKCECIHDSVGINVKQLMCKFYNKPYEEDYVDVDEKIPRKRRRKREDTKDSLKHSSPNASSRDTFKEVKVKEARECCLCPNTFYSSPGASHPFFELYNTAKDAKVHSICASVFPQQLSASRDPFSGAVSVAGIETISKSQRKLRCGVCAKGVNKPKDTGACFQCTYAKCTRAYHATCALSGGVQMDFSLGRFLCRYHREPAVVERLEKIGPHSWIQFTFNNAYYSGMVLANNVSEQSFNVLVYPSFRDLIEITYDSVLGDAVPLQTIPIGESILPMVSKRRSDPGIYSPNDLNYTSSPTTAVQHTSTVHMVHDMVYDRVVVSHSAKPLSAHR